MRAPSTTSSRTASDGESTGLAGVAHLDAVAAHLGPGILDTVLLHRGEIDPECLTRYRAEGAEPVTLDDAT